MTPFNPHAARSRWFTAPLADVTPRERALLDELAGAVAWAEGLGGAVEDGLDDEERTTVGNWLDGIDKGIWNPSVATKRHLAGILRRVLAEPRLERVGWLLHPGDRIISERSSCSPRCAQAQPVYVVREAR